MSENLINPSTKISYSSLTLHFSPELIKRFKSNDRIESFFWQKDPVLPVVADGSIKLMEWGNRDEQLRLPLTG